MAGEWLLLQVAQPERVLQPAEEVGDAMKMDNCRIYVRGNNLFSLDIISYIEL